MKTKYPKHQMLLLILLFLTSSAFMNSSLAQVKEEDFGGLEDNQLPLSILSEQLTILQLSIKSFFCQESIEATIFDKKSKTSSERKLLSRYEVNRQPDKPVSDKIFFSETRQPSISNGEIPSDPIVFPVIEEPFTGYIIRAFSFENRLGNDFKKVRREMVEGRECDVFSFETVREITVTKIPILGKTVPLRQRGLLWLDAATHQLVRIIAKQLKLPPGCRSYEYHIDFASQNLFGKTVSLPLRTELKVESKDKIYQVKQSYSQFHST